ncbi:MAG: proteasome assembly chaperone family protein [Candidatus Methanomethyliaceae archaeon]|nr:proteasome assembly chaperone family protein [Candidatus Methanomethyliaceae archaeon]MDW7971059.1 proteasome assembly chaperone family protein [Nitrososphaerota archaeon]
MSLEEISIIETTDIKVENPVIICGLPDVGLVGVIAVSHIIKSLDMEEVAYIDSEIFPPIVVFHRGTPTYPLRIYQKRNMLAIFSEIALTPESIHPLAKSIVNWSKEKKTSMLVSLGGVGVPNRLDIEIPKVYGASNMEYIRDNLKKMEILIMEEGFLVGPYALIAKYSLQERIPNLVLLAESYPNYPDPGAAASVITALNKFVTLNVDVKSLMDRSEEIRLSARELMRKTAENLKKMGKSQEYELPLMYV